MERPSWTIQTCLVCTSGSAYLLVIRTAFTSIDCPQVNDLGRS